MRLRESEAVNDEFDRMITKDLIATGIKAVLIVGLAAFLGVYLAL